jgi:hypothetical protein
MEQEKKSILFTIGVFVLGGMILLTVITYILALQDSQLAFINQTDLQFTITHVEKADDQTYYIEAEILNNNLEWTLEENGLEIGESINEDTETDEVRRMVENIYGQTTDSVSNQPSHITLSEVELSPDSDDLTTLSPYQRIQLSFIYQLEDETNNLLSLVFYSNQLHHRDGDIIRNIRTKTEEIDLTHIE